MPPLLVAEQLTKHYPGGIRALTRFNLTVAPGEVVGLLGPNGAGKSTALRSFLGFLRPTSGLARLAGYDCWSQSVLARQQVAYLPGELRLYDNMTGRELVRFLGQLRGEDYGEQVDLLARRLDINPDRRLTQMSSGMKRKAALLTVLLPDVPLIILDEPTNTLDPVMRDELLEQLRLAKEAGKAVLFSSHVLQEVESICDRVLILRQGELVHVQDMNALRGIRRIQGRFLAPMQSPPPGPWNLDPTSDPNGRFAVEVPEPARDWLAWLSHQPIADLRMEPVGLAGIYKHWHGTNA